MLKVELLKLAFGILLLCLPSFPKPQQQTTSSSTPSQDAQTPNTVPELSPQVEPFNKPSPTEGSLIQCANSFQRCLFFKREYRKRSVFSSKEWITNGIISDARYLESVQEPADVVFTKSGTMKSHRAQSIRTYLLLNVFL